MENVAAAWKACLAYFSLTATTIGERAFSTVGQGLSQVPVTKPQNFPKFP